jgi:(4S)-4-hydroxy-5-phosphonooxypentane-2,3-dione isomerase
MSKLVIIGTIEVDESARDALLVAVAAHRSRSLADEEGTLVFEVLVPQDSQTRLHLHEVFADDEAFERHRTGASIARLRDETQGIAFTLATTKCGFLE